MHPVFGAFVAGDRASPDAAAAQGDRRAAWSRSPSACWRRSSSASSACASICGRWAAAACWASSSRSPASASWSAARWARIWGGLRFWEAASIAVAMNARGAMEIVVATIGLSLGILTPQMFSIIVMVAIVTSFLAPLGLRLTMPRVRMTEDEARRILASESTGAFDPHARARAARDRGRRQRAGGGAAGLRPGAQEQRGGQDRPRRGATFLVAAAASPPVARRAAPTEQIEQMRALARGRPPEIAQVSGASVAGAICDEARRGCDVIVLGSGDAPSIGGPVVEQVVAARPVPRRDHEGARARHRVPPHPGARRRQRRLAPGGRAGAALRGGDRAPSWRSRC